MTKDSRERAVEIKRDRAGQLQRAIELLLLREVDFHGLAFGVAARRAAHGDGEQLEQIKFRAAPVEHAHAGVEGRDGDALAAQLQWSRERARRRDLVEEASGVRTVLVRPHRRERGLAALQFAAEKFLGSGVDVPHARRRIHEQRGPRV